VLRQLLQAIVAVAGWAVFVYWWWIVFGRVSRSEVAFTAIFVAVTAVISILVTGLWSLHNKRIHRRRGPRTQVRAVQETYSRDVLLRTISLPAKADRIKGVPVVEVLVGENRKVYRLPPVPGPGGPAGPGIAKDRERTRDHA
jgi:hypothetical protein